MMTTREREEDAALDKVDVAKLSKVVNDAVMAISSSTSLPAMEVLDILENIRVEMVSEVREAVEHLENRDKIRSVDMTKLCMGIEKAIETISTATDLDTDEITTIFSKERGASMDNVIKRLHAQSRHDRTLF